MSVRDLPRGVDLERDTRLDMIYGSYMFGETLMRSTPEGTLLGRCIYKLGYDGSVVSSEDVYGVRLFFD